jgi:competence protein ComEA
MPDAEARALRRAVVLLLMLSVARWLHASVDRRSSSMPEGEAAEAASLHAVRTRAALEEEEHRARPLGEGETIDPNRASAQELDRIPGVGPSKAQAIVTARASGAVFLQPEDLLVVRGFGPSVIERIRPHLSFSDAPPGRRSRTPGQGSRWERSGGRSAGAANAAARTQAPTSSPGLVDVNRAGSDELVRLPRIGPVTAQRIIAARRERPFASLEDLGRVPGIGPATVEALRGLVTVGPGRR